MEYIQFFDRDLGAWTDRFTLTAGYSESYVIDKTTDSAKDLKFKINQTERPKYKPNDWVRLVHVATKEEAMAYDSEGLPLNSSHYLIDGIQSIRGKECYNEWTISLTLKEPVERFNGVLGETLSFTNQTQKAFTELVGDTPVTTTYYKAPYNHYTALRRWLMVTPANCDSYPDYLAVGQDMNGKTIELKYVNLLAENYEGYLIGFSSGAELLVNISSTFNQFYTLNAGSNTFDKTISAGGANKYFTFDDSIGTITSISVNYTTKYYNSIRYIENYTTSPNNISWYNRIKVLDSEWLKTLPFADATYNELNLFNVLMDNFDASTRRTPVAYFDIDPVTDLPRNLNRDEYLLKFERQDGYDKPVIDFETLKHKNSGYSITQESANYATGLVCNAENISAASVVNYPAQNLYAVPEPKSDSRNTKTFTTQGSDDWIIRSPLPFKKISKLNKVKIYGEKLKNTPPNQYKTIREIEDITENVLEKKQYLAADSSAVGTSGDPYPTSNSKYCWYEEGSNELHIKSMYYSAPYIETESNPVDYVTIFYIEYEPLISCRLSVGDTEYQQQINQTASQIDADKFSKYAREYLNGMNKADITIGKRYYEYSDFENLIGSRVKNGDKTYMITQVAYRNVGAAGYDVFMQLNENHTRKNNAYNAPQSIRTNTAISTENIKNRQTAIKQVVKIGTTPQTAEGYQFLIDKKIALSALKPNAIDSKYYPQVVLIKGYSKLYTNSGLTASSNFELNKLATVAKFQFGKQINLVTTFFDNADAGKYKAGTEKEVTLGTNSYDTISKIESQVPVLYTDPFGEVQKVGLNFSSITSAGLTAINTGATTDATEYVKTLNAYQRMANLPNVDSATIIELENNKSINVENQIYFKDMLEKLNNNVIIEYKSMDVIVCNDLIKLSRLLNQTDGHNVVKVRFFDRAKSENDDVTTGLISTIGIANSTLNASDIRYTLDSGVADAEGLNMILLTANHEKLLIFNNISATIAEKLAGGYFDVYYA